MFHKQLRGARIAAVMLATGMAIGSGLATSGTAAADGGNGSGATDGPYVLQNGLVDGGAKITIDSDSRPYWGGLILLKGPNGSMIETYCIDLLTDAYPGAHYNETGWGSSSLAQHPENAAKINWILQHSYPRVSDLGQLAKEAGVDNLSPLQAAAATQAAIWHYSNQISGHQVDAVPKDDSDAAALTKYLEGDANTGQPQEPSPTLDLTPAKISGKSGDVLGPINVATSADSVAVQLDKTSAAAGLELTDKTGATVLSDSTGQLKNPAKNGDSLYVRVPKGLATGLGSVTASSTTKLQIGRVFTSEGNQTLIVAGGQPVSVSATIGLSWTPVGPALAVTSQVECADDLVDVTITNNGDQPFTTDVTVNGSFFKPVGVSPGSKQIVPVHVNQGAKYVIDISMPNGQKPAEVSGTLDCHVATAPPTVAPSAPASLAPVTPVNASTPSASATPTTGGKSLAFTGGGSNAGLIAGAAGALVLLGAGAVFTMRRRGRHSRTAA